MFRHKNKTKLLVGLVVLVLLLGLVVGASIASADGPVGEGAACRRSDCPVGATYQNGRWVELPGGGPAVWICDCVCTRPDASLMPAYRGIGRAYTIRANGGSINGASAFGRMWAGFWDVAEYRGWLSFELGHLPKEIEVATVVLEKVATTWLATDENASLIVELVDIGYDWPRNYNELDWPAPVAELLRLTVGEILEMVHYYDEPINIKVPPQLVEERVARGKRLTLRFRMEGGSPNNLFDVGGGMLYLKYAD